jgi:hypothetical protein
MSLSSKNINIGTNPESVKKGDIVVFMTGLKKSNTLPRVLRVGEVLQGYNDGVKYEDGKGYTVREFGSNKIWYPYTQDTILMDPKRPEIVRGISTKITYTENP